MKDFFSIILSIFSALLFVGLLFSFMVAPIFYFSKMAFNLKNVLQVLITLVFLYWPLVLFTTAMMFATKEAFDYPPFIFISNFILLYPLIISIILFLTQFKLWGLSPKYVLLSVFVLTYIASLGFSYPKLMINYLRGKSNNQVKNEDI